MPRFIEIALEKRGVSCVARLLDEDAPRTCDIVWDLLPLKGEIYHAKYARNEVYTFIPPPGVHPGLENPTITPIPGDVCYIPFAAGQLPARSYGYSEEEGAAGLPDIVDLALFYGRNNLLLNADIGFVPANVFASVTENFEGIAAACNDVWRNGAAGETLAFRKVDR
jgi:hypothetical protein